MVIVRPAEGVSYYMDPKLIKILDKIKKRVQTKDKDIVMIVDGLEGAGKSVFAMQICKYLDPTYNLDDVHMNPDSFNKGIENETVKHKAKHFDEAYKGLSSRASLSKVNRVVVSNMMQMRQLNLYCVVCIPTFFLLDRYVSLFRARYLFHIYEAANGDHKWIFFNRKNKQRLYLAGKKKMSYSYPRVHRYRGIFRGKYPIDEEAYRKKKRDALKEIEEFDAPGVKLRLQRNIILVDAIKRLGITQKQESKNLEEAGLKGDLRLPQSSISDICRNVRKIRENLSKRNANIY